jgi:pantoate--beta-alanine ligase
VLRISTPHQLTEWSSLVRARGETIAFVPTMGFLHEGHLSLMRAAKTKADHLVVSIFVNPLQFAPGEDLDRYPSDPEGDASKCKELGCDVLFSPVKADLYPEGFQTRVQVGALARHLCGASREGHFEGVATIVLKLFGLVRPTTALFGSKDYQQLQIIRRMVRDLDLGIEVVGMPIVREEDGLALSSRNAYLSEEERRQALVLSRSLRELENQIAAGERCVEVLLKRARSLIEEQPLSSIDYVSLVDAEELTPLESIGDRPVLAAVAVAFGKTRLIDNRVVRP